MFIAALVTRKQPKCPSSEEWMKTTWYMLTLECYSVTKRNEIRSFVEMWMNLEFVIYGEVRKKKIQYVNTYMWNLEKMVRSY